MVTCRCSSITITKNGTRYVGAAAVAWTETMWAQARDLSPENRTDWSDLGSQMGKRKVHHHIHRQKATHVHSMIYRERRLLTMEERKRILRTKKKKVGPPRGYLASPKNGYLPLPGLWPGCLTNGPRPVGPISILMTFMIWCSMVKKKWTTQAHRLTEDTRRKETSVFSVALVSWRESLLLQMFNAFNSSRRASFWCTDSLVASWKPQD